LITIHPVSFGQKEGNFFLILQVFFATFFRKNKIVSKGRCIGKVENDLKTHFGGKN